MAVDISHLFAYTVVPVKNGHPRDHAKTSLHDRWPLIRGAVEQAGGGNIVGPTPCTTITTSNINTEYMHIRNYVCCSY